MHLAAAQENLKRVKTCVRCGVPLGERSGGRLQPSLAEKRRGRRLAPSRELARRRPEAEQSVGIAVGELCQIGGRQR